MNQIDPPIVVFAYQRIDKLRRLIDSLLSQIEPDRVIYFFCDGPKSQSDSAKVEEVQDYASNLAWKNKVVVFQTKNLGLANSIQTGLDKVFSTFSSAIVLEDDLIVSQDAISYFDWGIRQFRDDPSVCSIQGYRHPAISTQNPLFLRGAGSWGWATWEDRWTSFRKQSTKPLVFSRKCVWEADFNGHYHYGRMLREMKSGKVDSWAVPWHLYNFCAGKVSLFPRFTLVNNEGLDGSGTHGSVDLTRELNSELGRGDPICGLNLNDVVENAPARAELINFYRSQKSLRRRIRRVINRLSKAEGKI